MENLLKMIEEAKGTISEVALGNYSQEQLRENFQRYSESEREAARICGPCTTKVYAGGNMVTLFEE